MYNKNNSFPASASLAFASSDPVQDRFKPPPENLQSKRTTSAFHPFQSHHSNTGNDNGPSVTYSHEQKTAETKITTDASIDLNQQSPGDSSLDMSKRVPPSLNAGKGKLGAKLTADDRKKRPSSTKRTESGGQFTFSTATTTKSSEEKKKLLTTPSRQQEPTSTRSLTLSTARLKDSGDTTFLHTPIEGSSTFTPFDDSHYTSRAKTHRKAGDDNPSRLSQKKKSTKRKKKSKTNRDESPTKKQIMNEMKPPPLEQQSTTRHVQKTQRRSKSERNVTKSSPNSTSSSERPGLTKRLSARDELRAFLKQDKESQRNLNPDEVVSRQQVNDPYIQEEQDRKRTERRDRKERYSRDTEAKEAKKDKKRTKEPSKPTRRKTRDPEMNRAAMEEATASGSRLPMHKQASLSTIESDAYSRPAVRPVSPDDLSPALINFFEWNKSPPANTHLRRRVLHRTPSSRGVVNHRQLLRKAHSTSDIHQFHLTPEWPTSRRNVRLHSMFYDLSIRRQNVTRASSPGRRQVSAHEMLQIMEPCSRREVMAAQGIDCSDSIGYRDDYVLNYGEILDTISLTSSQKANARRRGQNGKQRIEK
jgi:hypothetical protein